MSFFSFLPAHEGNKEASVASELRLRISLEDAAVAAAVCCCTGLAVSTSACTQKSVRVPVNIFKHLARCESTCSIGETFPQLFFLLVLSVHVLEEMVGKKLKCWLCVSRLTDRM